MSYDIRTDLRVYSSSLTNLDLGTLDQYDVYVYTGSSATTWTLPPADSSEGWSIAIINQSSYTLSVHQKEDNPDNNYEDRYIFITGTASKRQVYYVYSGGNLMLVNGYVPRWEVNMWIIESAISGSYG